MRVAVIPARGGSRGVPGKNLMSIAGRSLLGHAIRCCQLAGVDLVLVSTDCREIAALAYQCGAVVVTRPEELAGDASSSQDALRHALQGVDADAVAFVQCTAPMLEVEDVSGCLDKLPGSDVVVCCVPFDGVVVDRMGRPLNRAVGGSQRRQDQPRQYLITGGCWAFRPNYLSQPWMSGRVGIHLAKYPHRIEVDSAEDVQLAEAVLENLLHRHGQHALPDGRHGVCGSAAVARPDRDSEPAV